MIYTFIFNIVSFFFFEKVLRFDAMGLAKISLPSFFIALPLNIIMLIMILRHQTTIHFTGLADGTPFFDNTTTTTLGTQPKNLYVTLSYMA